MDSWNPLIDVLSAVLAPLVAVLGIIFTVRQHQLDCKKRKDELFNRRWDFYRRAKENFLKELSEVIQGKEISVASKLVKNWTDHYADEAFFLFGGDIERHVQSLPKEIIKRKDAKTLEEPIGCFRKPFEKYLELK